MVIEIMKTFHTNGNILENGNMKQEERKNHQVHDADTFLEYRRKQEQVHLNRIKGSTNPLDAIITIELNTTELCNRKCIFCPRFAADVYPNRNLNMSVEVAEKIAKHLADANYTGRISFSGYSEGLLNKSFADIVFTFRKHLKDNLLECNTNGDVLGTRVNPQDLYNSGLDMLYINMYDGPDQADHFLKIMEEAGVSKRKFSLRAHYNLKDYGLKLNNRSGVIDWIGFEDHDIEELKGKPCHYPFYKMFVDWNGDVLFCSNDWGKERKIGNIAKQTLEEVWMADDMKEIRQRLKHGDRSQSPCDKCSVKGDLFGKPSFDLINKHYESSDNGNN